VGVVNVIVGSGVGVAGLSSGIGWGIEVRIGKSGLGVGFGLIGIVSGRSGPGPGQARYQNSCVGGWWRKGMKKWGGGKYAFSSSIFNFKQVYKDAFRHECTVLLYLQFFSKK